MGKKEVKALIKPFMITPVFETQPEFFSDWGDPRVFTLNDLGIGECAGEVVSLFSIEISKAESAVFDAQVALDEGNYAQADDGAYQAMLEGARALLRTKDPNVGTDPEEIVSKFKTDFYDTELFFDQFAKGKFAKYLFSRHSREKVVPTVEVARQTIEEAQLFIEAAHACDMRLNTTVVEASAPVTKPGLAGKLPPGMSPRTPKLPPSVNKN